MALGTKNGYRALAADEIFPESTDLVNIYNYSSVSLTMPTVDVKKDLLFKALGQEYSKIFTIYTRACVV